MFYQQMSPNFQIARTINSSESNFQRTTGRSTEDNATWKAAYTKQHHEKTAARHLAELGVECFLPLYVQERHWSNNRNPILELPLFPNYLFVRVSAHSRI